MVSLIKAKIAGFFALLIGALLAILKYKSNKIEKLEEELLIKEREREIEKSYKERLKQAINEEPEIIRKRIENAKKDRTSKFNNL